MSLSAVQGKVDSLLFILAAGAEKVVEGIRKFETWTTGGYGLVKEHIQTWEVQTWEDRGGDS